MAVAEEEEAQDFKRSRSVSGYSGVCAWFFFLPGCLLSCLMTDFQSSIIPTTNTSGVLTKSGVRGSSRGGYYFYFLFNPMNIFAVTVVWLPSPSKQCKQVELMTTRHRNSLCSNPSDRRRLLVSGKVSASCTRQPMRIVVMALG